MSEPSYFDNGKAALALRKEALSWLGTPFAECYVEEIPNMPEPDLKGPTGAIDCISLVNEIFSRIGVSDRFVLKRSPADYQSHQTGEKNLNWLRGKAEDPQSKWLGSVLLELKIPDKVTQRDAETPRDFFKPGDILVLQHGSLFHMPVIYDDDLHFVNALPRRGVIEGTIQDFSYSQHLVAVFRVKPKADWNVL